ncbi:MAG: hypothetical protein JRF41_14360 [Deltaproteobacteria bacterium]|nr:hypothetical protein [Deltaproteobacteria bacterium]
MHYSSYTSEFDVKDPVWQRRYYNFNLYTDKKLVEKIKYMHENPVRGGFWVRTILFVGTIVWSKNPAPGMTSCACGVHTTLTSCMHRPEKTLR